MLSSLTTFLIKYINWNKLRLYFQKNQLNDLVNGKVQEIIQSQNVIKLNELDYKAKSKKHNFSKISFPIIFSSEIHTGVLSQMMLMKNKVRVFYKPKQTEG